MKKTVSLTESELIRLIKKVINEQSSENTPTITSIDVMTPTSADRTNIDFTGALGVVNCDENPNTKRRYSLNNMRLDGDLIQQAIGDDTKIGIFYYDDTKSKFVKVHEEPQRKDSLTYKIEIPKNKIPNLSDDTHLAVCVIKGGRAYEYNGKNVYTLTNGFML